MTAIRLTGNTMIKIILIAVSAILIGLVIIYSWFNRDSDRVILTLVTAMTIGSLGFITKESISNKAESFSRTFPVAVFYGLPNYTPLNIKLPYSFDLRMCLQNLNPKDIPETKNEIVDIDFASKKYFDAIEYLVTKTIFEKFGRGWNVKVRRIHTPNGESLSWSNTEDKGKEITIKEFLKFLPNNYFVKLGLQNDIPEPFGGKAVFPPDTVISIESNDKFSETLMSFSTKYISLDVKISQSSSSIGIGEYTKLFGIPSALDRRNAGEGDRLGNSVYLVEVNVKQNYWLNGHPEMKKHRNWADSISELLDSKFNYEIIRDEHLRQYQLYGVEGIKGL